MLGEVLDRVERPLMYGLAAVLVGVGIRLEGRLFELMRQVNAR